MGVPEGCQDVDRCGGELGKSVEQGCCESSSSLSPSPSDNFRADQSSPKGQKDPEARTKKSEGGDEVIEGVSNVGSSVPEQVCVVSQAKSRNFVVQYFKKKSQGWSREEFAIIVILAFVEFFAAAVVSIQAPFFPDVARQKGASATESGLVFALFEITVFIVSPIYGAKMNTLGPTRVFNVGIFVTGTCCLIFGLLDEIQGRVPFIASCLVVRVIEAMGDAAFETASFTIIAIEFPNAVATTFAILEISFGLGLIIGPALGGALYELGGYKLPFLFSGTLLFASAVATYFFLPEPGSSRRKAKGECDGDGEEGSKASPVDLGGFGMFKMLKIPVIAMTAYSIVAANSGMGFLSNNLDNHLGQFHLNKLAVGAVFVLNGAVYGATAPMWGWICDHTDRQKLITLLGAVFIIVGFLFIGPVPYFPYDTTLPMTCFGLGLFGIGVAATLVSAFLQALKDAIDRGYPDDVSTYGLVSGLWTSMAALGYFIGPAVGGILDDWVGFRWGSLFVIGGQVILILMLIGYYSTATCVRSASKDLESFPSPRNKQEISRMEEDVKNHNLKSFQQQLNEKQQDCVIISNYVHLPD